MIFNVLIKTDHEARIARIILPSETNKIKFAIDAVYREKLKWKDALLIKGWAFRENTVKKDRELFLVLRSISNTLIFKIENDSISRPDVTDFFYIAGGVHNHGFETNIPSYFLNESTYQIGFAIWDVTGKYFTMSLKELKIADGEVTIDNSVSELDSVSNSNQLSLTLKEPTCKVNYNFETVCVLNNKLIISGWGYCTGMNTASLKSYILLKQNENVRIFDVCPQIRKDVTSYFATTGLNLDSCGFQAKIPTENMGNGNYQLGLYTVKGNQVGIVYTDKVIKVGP